MYKDEEIRRNKAKERMQKMRERKGVTSGVTKEQGVTSKPVIPQGVTLYRYVGGKKETLTEVPEGYRVLSDGQVWKPLPETIFIESRVSNEPPIMKYLIPGVDRQGMEAIVESLKGHRTFGLNDVFFGIGKTSISMDRVDELLVATG